MRVKIIKSKRNSLWYSDHVGEVFDVVYVFNEEGYEEFDYKTLPPYAYSSNDWHYICEEDCVPMNKDNEGTMKSLQARLQSRISKRSAAITGLIAAINWSKGQWPESTYRLKYELKKLEKDQKLDKDILSVW